MRSFLPLFLALAPLLAGAPASGDEAAKSGPAGSADGFFVHGRATLSYVFRSTGESDAEKRRSDQDMIQDVFIEAGRGSWLRLEASGRLHEDIDGRPLVSPFRDIYDSYGDAVTGWLYTAYAELLEQGPIARLRAGRQYYDAVGVRFDGGLLETVPLGDAVRLVAYGGSPVNLYEASRTGDWLAGGAFELVFIPRTSIRFDYVHLTDERKDLLADPRLSGFFPDTNRDDDYFQLVVVHRLTEKIRLRGLASTFEGRSSRFEGDLLYLDQAIDLTARFRYIAQLGAYRDLSIQFTPLDDTLGAYEPYHELMGDVTKGLGENVSIGAGGAWRILQDENDEGPYNHEFGRLFGRLDVVEFPWTGLSLSLLAEWYRSEVHDWMFQGSADLAQRIGAFTIGGGTSYALYRFNEFFLEEREDVRSYYGSFEWRALEWLRLRLSYSYETDDEERYHVVRMDVRVHF